MNDRHKQKMVEKIIAIAGGDCTRKKIGILGLTFKAHTDDVRESPALTIIPALSEAGAKVVAFDPKGMDQAEKVLSQCDFVDTPEQVFDAADLIVVITEWPQFQQLDWAGLCTTMKNPVVVDLRNMLDAQELRGAGFAYHSIGGYGAQ